jgi:hypothetical protein
MGKLSPLSSLRPTTSTSTITCTAQQVRHATYVARPRRPYTFTQIIQLSDGSAYTHRTTSPQALYRANKDSRNTLTWNPSETALRNVEVDEAGKLAAFRERFGRAFDNQNKEEGSEEVEEVEDEGYGDLIASYAPDRSHEMKTQAPPQKSGKGGKKK